MSWTIRNIEDGTTQSSDKCTKYGHTELIYDHHFGLMRVPRNSTCGLSDVGCNRLTCQLECDENNSNPVNKK